MLDEDYPQGSRAISLFPLRQPEMKEEVTRGVRVRPAAAGGGGGYIHA